MRDRASVRRLWLAGRSTVARPEFAARSVRGALERSGQYQTRVEVSDHLSELTFSVVGSTEVDDAEVLRVYESSGLGDRRPVYEPGRLRRMLDGANLIVAAVGAKGMVGIARSITDFSYATYVSDIAVTAEWQRRGVGRQLIRLTAEAAPQAKIVLLSAPSAVNYYPHLGFTQHPSAWTLPALSP